MNNSRTLLLTLLATFSSLSLQAAAPPPPTSVRTVILPSEVLLTWEPSPGAAYYKVYRGGPDRRWVPLAPVTEPRFRDTDFVPLPGYYQIAAFASSGEGSATAEFPVFPATANISLIGVTPRPRSDTSFAVAWTINGPQPFTGFGDGGGGDGMLEIGPDLDHMTLVGASSVISERHEFVASNLLPDTTYVYRLTSAGANGAGFTYWNTFTTRAYTPPPPVVLVLDANPTLTADEDVPVDFTCTVQNPAGPLDVIILEAPSGMVMGTFPNFSYVSNPEHPGVEYFDCLVTDGFFMNFVRVNVDVRRVEDPPIAQDFSLAYPEDTGSKFFVRATGWDFGPDLGCEVVAGPTNGVLTRNAFAPLELQYVPNTNFFGIDHIAYRCFDGDSTGNVATIRIHVSPLNDGPVARPQAVTLVAGTSQLITLDASEPDRDTLTFSVLSGPAHGTLAGPSPNILGQFTYTPTAGYLGPDSFTWSVSDGTGLSASATVSILVTPPPPPPAPSGLSAAPGPRTRVDLSWSDNSGNESGFKIERSLSATSGWAEIGVVGPNVRTFAATGQKPNKTYYFRVRAYNATGLSAYSNTASAKARN